MPLGSLKHDKHLLKEFAAHFHALLLGRELTEHGKAAIHREIGDSYRYAGELTAERAYLDAINGRTLTLLGVYMAECLPLP